MQDETTQAVVESSVLDDIWGDDSVEVEESAMETEALADDANQHSEPETEEEQNEAETVEEAAHDDDAQTETQGEPAPESFTLRYMKEDKQYSREDVIKYAQQGLDYSRIRTERDSLKAEMPTLQEYKGFLEELAADSGTTVDKMIEDIRTNRLVERESKAGRAITDLAAREQIQREKAARTQPAKTEDEPEAEEAPNQEQKQAEKTNPDVVNFCKAYPNVQAKDIPQSVWDEVKAGSDLTSAYTRYENKQLRIQIEAMQQNEKNKNRSTGSRKSSGGTQKSAFDAAWDAADY